MTIFFRPRFFFKTSYKKNISRLGFSKIDPTSVKQDQNFFKCSKRSGSK